MARAQFHIKVYNIFSKFVTFYRICHVLRNTPEARNEELRTRFNGILHGENTLFYLFIKPYDDTPSSLGVIQWRQTFPIKTEMFSFGSISWQGFLDLKSTCSIVGLWRIPTAAGFHLVSNTFNPFSKFVKYDDTPSSLGVIQWRQTFPIKTEHRNRN